jgi:phosphoglycerate dehydrogenase-like enzyme
VDSRPILLANKGYFRNEREFSNPEIRYKAFHGRGNFGNTVSLLGAGVIGRTVLNLLKPFNLKVCVFDPFLSAEDALALGVSKVELLEAFERGNVVSNHLANLPATVGLLRGEHLAALPQNATFINTGRGATVRENEMIEVLQQRSDLSALLDVTYPEPPREDSPLWTMPNVFLTSHIAGSIGDEVVRMADYIIEEFDAWEKGEPLRIASVSNVGNDGLEKDHHGTNPSFRPTNQHFDAGVSKSRRTVSRAWRTTSPSPESVEKVALLSSSHSGSGSSSP